MNQFDIKQCGEGERIVENNLSKICSNSEIYGFFMYKDEEGYTLEKFEKIKKEQIDFLGSKGLKPCRDIQIIEKTAEQNDCCGKRPTIGWKAMFEKMENLNESTKKA